MAYIYGTKLARAVSPPLPGAPAKGPDTPAALYGGLPIPSGEAVFTVAGTYIFTVPHGPREISVVCVGGGNGVGSLTTSTGTSHFNNSLYAFGSNGRTGGGFQGGDGGGVGGTGGLSSVSTSSSGTNRAGGSGGGAGGYSGNGGNASNSLSANPTISLPTSHTRLGGAGGGVDIYGQGDKGEGAPRASDSTGPGFPGEGGGGGGGSGSRVSTTVQESGRQGQGGSGGLPFIGGAIGSFIAAGYGGGSGLSADGLGGGGLGWKNNIPVSPGQQIPIKVGNNGAVRIIWGKNRRFPFNAK